MIETLIMEELGMSFRMIMNGIGTKFLQDSQVVPVPKPQDNNDATKAVVGGAVAVGAGYIIYRGIRMLPSLAPPLWATIPANAICP